MLADPTTRQEILHAPERAVVQFLEEVIDRPDSIAVRFATPYVGGGNRAESDVHRHHAAFVHIEITVEGSEALGAYASIPIAYRVTEVVDVDTPLRSPGVLPFEFSMLDVPRLKDYDAQPGNHPPDRPARFDVHGWTILVAISGSTPVGGAIIVAADPDILMLEGRENLMLLWDIRAEASVPRSWRPPTHGRGLMARAHSRWKRRTRTCRRAVLREAWLRASHGTARCVSGIAGRSAAPLA